MIKTEFIANAINYFQRINYTFKAQLAKRNYVVGSPFAKARINTLNFYQTINLYEKAELDTNFKGKDKEVFDTKPAFKLSSHDTHKVLLHTRNKQKKGRKN